MLESVETLIKSRRDAALAAVDVALASAKPGSYEAISLTTRRKSLLDNMPLRVSVREGAIRETLVGTVDNVLERLDPRVVHKVDFEVSVDVPPARIEINFWWGVDLEVSGEKAWVQQAFPALSEVIKRDVPWYGWFMNPLNAGGLAGVAAFFGSASVAQKDMSTTARYLLALVWGVGAAFWVATAFWKWVPSFELVEQGQRSRARVILGVLGAGVLAVVAGVVSIHLARG